MLVRPAWEMEMYVAQLEVHEGFGQVPAATVPEGRLTMTTGGGNGEE